MNCFYVFTDEQMQEALLEWLEAHAEDGQHSCSTAAEIIRDFMHSEILARKLMRREVDG